MSKRMVIEPGMRFGDGSRLEVIREVAPIMSGDCRQRAVECRCDCGDVRVYRLYSLRNGNTRSCGCLAKEEAGNGAKTHGMSKTSEYGIWRGMIRRCSNPNDEAWKNYGGRGIKVCERWRESFEAFFADMGKRPSDDHSIDRFPNNNGDYEPGNCRWATSMEQMRNTRVNRLIEYKGKRKCVAEWAEQYGVRPGILYVRLFKSGWTFEEAVGLCRRIRHWHGDPFYKIPEAERGPGWYQEHERREVGRIAQARKEMELYGDELARLYCVDASEFKLRVDKALVAGESRHHAICTAAEEMAVVGGVEAGVVCGEASVW